MTIKVFPHSVLCTAKGAVLTANEFRAGHGLSPIRLGESAPPRPLSITAEMAAYCEKPVRYRQSAGGSRVELPLCPGSPT